MLNNAVTSIRGIKQASPTRRRTSWKEHVAFYFSVPTALPLCARARSFEAVLVDAVEYLFFFFFGHRIPFTSFLYTRPFEQDEDIGSKFSLVFKTFPELILFVLASTSNPRSRVVPNPNPNPSEFSRGLLEQEARMQRWRRNGGEFES